MTHSYLDAEQAVVGSLLISPECLSVLEGALRPEEFALEAHRAIYRAALALERAGKPVDPVTILRELAEQKADVSRAYLMQLMEVTPTAAHVAEYAAQVREGALRRALEALGQTLCRRVEEQDPTAAILSDATQTLDQLQSQGVTDDLISSAGAVAEFYQYRQAVEQGRARQVVPTGYRDLDALLGGGMLASGMYTLAARPGMGKTTLALNIADRVAQRVGPVLFVSLEMDQEQITAKRISRCSGIPGNRLLMDKLTEGEYQRMADAAAQLSRLPLTVNKAPYATVDDVAMLARRVKDLRLIVIDYIGKLSPPASARRKDRIEYMTEISGAIKTLARMLHVPILALCQLNRQTEARSDKRPQLSDLRDTGAIEQDSDGVLFLHRPDYYNRDETRDLFAPSLLEVFVEKNRHGRTGKCELAMCLASSRVHPVSNDPRRAARMEAAGA